MVVSSVTLAGRVIGGAAPVTLAGRVAGEPPTLSAAVSRAVVDSFEGPVIYYGIRVVLDGEEVPQVDLAGPLEIEESLDTPLVTFSLTLSGRQYSPLATTRVWTRTPVEVYTLHGRPGAVRESLRVAGVVRSCQEQEGSIYRISCANHAILYERRNVCYEVPPGSGLTRGALCEGVLAGVGLLEADIPPGAIFSKAWLADSQPLWDALREFGEPEGWYWTVLPDRTVVAFTADIKDVPDHVWTENDVAALSTAPPGDFPSRWVARGTTVVRTDEAGLTQRVTRTEIKALFAPGAAVSKQQTDGTVVPSGVTQPGESFITVSVVEDVHTEQAGRTVSQITREWGWYNPLAARLRTRASAGEPPGPVEEGYYFTRAWIDADGAYRAWPREQFVLKGERRQYPRYGPDGSLASQRSEVYRWHTRTMGVRNVQSDELNVAGAGVGGDDQSYFPFETSAAGTLLVLESFGLAEVLERTHTYGPTGAEVEEVQETWGYYSPRTATKDVPWYVTYAGTGQFELVAQWRLFRRQTVRNILAEDGLLLGKVEAREGYGVARRIGGPFDWGDTASNAPVESWRHLEVKNISYNVLNEDSYEEVADDGTPARVISGRPPMPRYMGSAWTQMVQTPLEMIVEDEAAKAWFGDRSEVISNDFVQSLEEALALVERRRAREIAMQHEVTRPVSNARLGDTVFLVSETAGLWHPAIVSRVRERWELNPQTRAMATYTLEQPL